VEQEVPKQREVTVKKPKVVVALLSEDQEFQVMQADDARAAGSRLGLDLEVVFAEGNPIVQIQQLFRFIHARDDRPLALVVESTTGEGLERVARNAVGAGIGWLLVNTEVDYLDALRREHPELPIAAMGGDQKEVGRIQGRQVRRMLPRGGAILCIQGPADSTVTAGRAQGLADTLDPARYRLKAVNGDWTEKGGARAMSSWLRLKTVELFRPEAVVCQNDIMALGARGVLRAQRPDWSQVPFLGCDGLPAGGQRAVEAGMLAATVRIPSNTGPALDLLATWVEDRKPLPALVLLPPSSLPSESRIVEHRSIHEGARVAPPAP
jgi:ABC-type sugar transport system substrate-binding protein